MTTIHNYVINTNPAHPAHGYGAERGWVYGHVRDAVAGRRVERRRGVSAGRMNSDEYRATLGM